MVEEEAILPLPMRQEGEQRVFPHSSSGAKGGMLGRARNPAERETDTIPNDAHRTGEAPPASGSE